MGGAGEVGCGFEGVRSGELVDSNPNEASRPGYGWT